MEGGGTSLICSIIIMFTVKMLKFKLTQMTFLLAKILDNNIP